MSLPVRPSQRAYFSSGRFFRGKKEKGQNLLEKFLTKIFSHLTLFIISDTSLQIYFFVIFS